MKWTFAPLMALAALPLLGQVTLSSAVNAASYANPVLPNGNLAEGGVFIAFGSGMGPAKLQEISAFPLPTTLGGTSIAVTVNGTTVNCIMLYTSATQVAAVLPSDTPAGAGTMVLSYNGTPSAALNVNVAAHDFGIFAINQGGSGAGVVTNAITNAVISNTGSANPGTLLDIWGTGLGPVAGNEAAGPLPGNIPNLPIEVFVGSQKATVNYAGRSGCCTGLDQIEIVAPSGVYGCAVPVYFVVGGVTSNFVTTSIVQSGSTCSNPNALTASQLASAQANGGLRTGSASLLRGHVYTAKTNYVSDTASVSFAKVPLADLQLVAISPLPAANTCSVTPFPISLPAGYAASTALQAGTITLSGPVGPYTLISPQPGDYQIVFSPSTVTPESGIINDGTVLTPGTYTFTGTAGADIGAFNVSIPLPAALNWTNRPSVPATIPRNQPLTITWTNGYSGALLAITGQSSASLGVGAGFTCWADATAGTFTVPAAILEALPPTFSVGGIPQGSIDVHQQYTGPSFTASGIDMGTTMFSDGFDIGPITYQ
jgi:uncharacterized protein (TIGR03437 family)